MTDRTPGSADQSTFDMIVIGGGAAGFWTAIRAAEAGGEICLISRKPLSESSSYWAQGGLAAALDPADSPELHAEDTFAAGRGLCREAAVRCLTEEAPAMVRDLIARGVRFDEEPSGAVQLALEGGHSVRRIVHAGGSATGHEITRSLSKMVADHPGIEVREETSAVALLSDDSSCLGVLTDHGAVFAPATVLATGGAAALWSRTSNPWGAIGAGPVMASAAGAELADLEFCQFHPTCLDLPGSELDGSLISEALRGEGAMLLDAEGERFTDELAPRDDVAVAILQQIDAQEGRPVDLDLRMIDPARFPSVFGMLDRAGLDPTGRPVPISPGAHYTMGGITVDLDGQSTLPGLFAVGECSCTGLHGANRLASNSLSECFVFGERAARAGLDREGLGRTAGQSTEPAFRPDPEWRFDPPVTATREAVWKLAGPRRDRDGLGRLLDDPYPLAGAIARSALTRTESRGGHRRSDFPDRDPDLDGVHIHFLPDGSVRSETWD
jgi:L-aspartate oxidase